MVHLSISSNPRISFHCIYEDEHIALINKPAGLATQPGIRHEHTSLLNGLFSKWGKTLQNLGKKRDYGLLHRLDRGTSGLVVIGLSIEGYEGMRSLFQTRQIEKTYIGLIRGTLDPLSGQCNWPIEERKIQGKKRAYVHQYSKSSLSSSYSSHLPSKKKQRYSKSKNKKGSSSTSHSGHIQKALTSYQTLTHTKQASLIKCQIKTGRLHQIRAHMSILGHPIIGDFDYGGKHPLNVMYRNLERGTHALHASQLSFIHPCTKKELMFTAPPPSTFIEMTYLLGLSLDS